MDLGEVAFLVAVVLVAATAQTVAGFGFALIAVPFLVVMLDVKDAVVTVGVLAWLNSTLVAVATFGRVPVRPVTVMLLGSFVGMPLGLLVLLFAPEDALRLAVGVVSVAMASALMLGLRWGGRNVPTELLAGGVSGVLNTSTGMNGPPIVLYLQDRGFPTDEFRGGLSAFFFVSGIVSFVIFVSSGVVTGTALALAAAGLPAVFAGNWVGHRLVGRMSAEAFRRLVLGLLVVTACAAIVISAVRILA
jgi:uncharacterized membrane protein YfcA